MSNPQYPGQPEQYPSGGAYPGGQYPAGSGYGSYGERPAPSRPGTLLAGCILTWVGSALGLLLGIGLLALSGSKDLFDAFPDSTARDDAELIAQTTGVLLIVSCLLALLFSILAFAGKRWAAIALTALGALWILLAIYGLVTGGGGSSALPIVWIGLSVGLVMAASKEWFDHKSGRPVSS